MKISDWLDEKEAENVDVSQIVLPADMSFDEAPEETIYFKEIKPCGLLCTENHPFMARPLRVEQQLSIIVRSLI